VPLSARVFQARQVRQRFFIRHANSALQNIDFRPFRPTFSLRSTARRLLIIFRLKTRKPRLRLDDIETDASVSD